LYNKNKNKVYCIQVIRTEDIIVPLNI
jgi:hypothetical protein